MFRRRHRLHGPFALYGGRIDPGKGCEELIEYFSSYVQRGRRRVAGADGREADAAARGAVGPLRRPALGRERLQALEAATVVVVPSPYESLSLLALEAFAVGTPVLANARSEVLVDHCRKSNAGLFYADRDEFVEAPEAAAGRRPAARRDGPQRHATTCGSNYRWDVIISEVRTDVRAAATAEPAVSGDQPA